ncbi:MAG: imidazole glycerol phosphate synthase subunit HisH [Deltaproteobacteria bacterium]|nr:imidazole glycerol phosphate synthase subunit HisH [Deltaproteobacteria bacterium]
MIAVVDYGMGNLRSVAKAIEQVGFPARVTSEPQALRDARGVVLPGVGAFRDCMANLKSLGLIDPLLEWIGAGRPFLGVCLGYQVLFTEGEEFGRHRGLDVIRGRVVRFPPAAGLKVPHMGWNQLEVQPGSTLLRGIPNGAYVYFVHSYYALVEEPVTVARATHGVTFSAAVERGALFGTQFHPEKSQQVGLQLYRNFAERCWSSRP